MASKRQLQVGELIKRNFSMVLFQEGRYLYGSEVLVSVTHVNMSPDLGLAKIYLSIYNTEHKEEVLMEIQYGLHRLKQLLSNRIKRHVRRVPDIDIYIDETLDEIDRVENLFDNIKKPEK